MSDDSTVTNFEEIRKARDWSFETLVSHLERSNAAKELVEHFRSKTVEEAAQARSAVVAPTAAPINPTPVQTRTAADSTPVQQNA